MKRFWIWQYMINKRLLRKKEFVILLCLIPLLVWGITMISKEDSGVLTIALAMEEEDGDAAPIIEEMLKEDSMIQYIPTGVEEAYKKVNTKEVDCAWIFREDFTEKLITTFDRWDEKEAPVYVVAQEDNVALQLARTKLYGNIFPHLAYLLCQDYLETEVMEGESVSEEELRQAYEKSMVEGTLIRTVYISPDDMTNVSERKERTTEQKISYLITPVRGLLIVLIIVAGLVVTMYYLQDEERGMFAWVPIPKRRGLLYSYILAAVFDTSVVVLLSLLISEGRLLSLRELIVLILYLPVTAVFCEFLKIICHKKEHLAKCIPLLCLAMLGFCPVFLNPGRSFVPQYLFPPTYYLRVGNDLKQLWGMLVYGAVLFAGETAYGRFIGKRL